MMTKMTRYKPQSDVEDDISSVNSIRTDEISDGTTRVHYHMGTAPFSKLEKCLLVHVALLVGIVVVLTTILHAHGMDHSEEAWNKEKSDQQPCLSKECVVIAADVLSKMNASINPCDDFYEYSCGGWLASSIKPEGKASWGTLSKLSSDNEVIMRKALESKEEALSEAEEKAKIFYRACIDNNGTIETRGKDPLVKLLEKTGGWSLSGNWTSENYNMEEDILLSKSEFNSGALFSWGVAEDDKDSSKYIIQIDQGGLMLPARDFYLNVSEKSVPEAYVKYITKIGVLLGAPKNQSRAVAKDILKFETSLAEFSMSYEKRRDDDTLYHKMTLESLSTVAPFINWTRFVSSSFRKVNRQIMPSEKIVVYSQEYLMKLSQLLKTLSLKPKGNTTIHNYLTWHVIKNYIGYLSRDFREAYSILEKAQIGVGGGLEEWRECVEATDAAVGPALGAMYIRRAFDLKARHMANDMVNRIRKTFRDNLGSTPWMSQKTREDALDKADAIEQMIGYPDYITNPAELNKKLEDLEVQEDQFFENNINVIHFKVKENLVKLFQRVNKTRWGISPPTVNAYYATTRNNIALPAGILQPPLFSKNNPQALNYGAVGVVMGHELSHAFDDQGRKYDKNGNLHSWWENRTVELFKNRTKCMVDQYSSYTLKDEHLKGALTLGENIADNGGLKASFQAYQNWLNENKVDVKLPGINLSSSQLFFLSFGQVWCSILTKEAAHLEILRDSHVLPRFRVIGTLSNSKDFADAFSCDANSDMNPPNKCVVW